MFVLVTVSLCESLELYTDNLALCNPNCSEFVAPCFQVSPPLFSRKLHARLG